MGTPRLSRGDKLHHKFAVIDGKTVITGSFNWSPAAAHTNDETLLVIHSPTLAAHFTGSGRAAHSAAAAQAENGSADRQNPSLANLVRNCKRSIRDPRRRKAPEHL